jgi:hypothetical protein
MAVFFFNLPSGRAGLITAPQLRPARSRYRAKHAFGVTALAKAAYAVIGIVFSIKC